MSRHSGTIVIGLAVCLLIRGQGSAQDTGLLAPAIISEQISAAAPLDGADFLQPDSDVELAAWLQQSAMAAPAPAPTGQVRRTTRGSRQANVGLASVPNMFGDLAGATSTFISRDVANPAGAGKITVGTFTLPIAGGGSRVGKISENDSPIPRDRVFFSYNHFENVFQISETPQTPPGPRVLRQEPIDRYTLGFEKTFFDGWTSVELRMPFVGTIDTQLTTVGYTSGNIGNLTAVLKSLV